MDSIGGRFAVKGFFDGFGGPFSAADFDFELGARGGEGWREVGHGDASGEAWGDAAAGEFADGVVVVEDWVVGAGWGGARGHADGGEAGGEAGCFLGEERVAAGEGALLEGDEEAEAGFERRAVVGEVVAVEWVAHFEPERVACAEAAWGGTGGDGFLEPCGAVGGWGEEFEAVFAGVAGAADDAGGAVEGELGDAVAWREGGGAVGDGVEDLRGERALDGHGGPCGAVVGEGDAGGGVLGEPCAVLVETAGIDDEEPLVVIEPVGDEVVDDAAFFVEEERVLALTGVEGGGVVGEEGVEPCGGVGAGDEEFAHVGDVEDAAGGADGEVLSGDACVLDGHIPACEGDHAGSEGEVGREERGLGESWSVHVRYRGDLSIIVKGVILWNAFARRARAVSGLREL